MPIKSGDNLLIELTTENGKIILGGAEGTITLLLTAEETESLTWNAGQYTLTLTAEPDGDTDSLLTGAIRVQGP